MLMDHLEHKENMNPLFAERVTIAKLPLPSNLAQEGTFVPAEHTNHIDVTIFRHAPVVM